MKNNQKIQLTKVGYASLKLEYEDLVNNKRPQLVERLSNARGEGDLAENSDYSNARDELEFLDGRIDELSAVLKNAEVISNGKPGSGVGLGTRVTVKSNGATHTFHIVGDWEADPGEKKISHTSPLGLALINKAVGDSVEVEAPAGKVLYKILSIE